MLGKFSDLPPEAKIWVYFTKTTLTQVEQAQLNVVLDTFCQQWTAHNNALVAAYSWYGAHFLIIGVDESHAGASGCSIDKSVALLRGIKEQTGIDFLNREAFPYLDIEGQVAFIKPTAIKEAIANNIVTMDTEFFNVAASTNAVFQNEWLVKAQYTWVKRYFNTVNL